MTIKIENAKQELLLSNFFMEPLVNSITDLKMMMEHHVFIVWNFMCLEKILQALIAPTFSPWIPKIESNGVRLIN